MRVVMLVLAILYAVVAAFTALVGLFADGDDILSRLSLVLVHPLAAAALLLLVVRSTASRKTVLAIAAFLLATVAADLSFAIAIGSGAMKGSWEIPVVFAVVPTLGVLYALLLAMRSARLAPR